MSFTYWFTAAALASLPLAAGAQQIQQRFDPSDANAAVPASNYESAFRNYKAAVAEQQSPDKSWRAANREMEKLGGHAGQMKGEGGVPPVSPTPTKAAPIDHGKHHQSEGK